VPGLTVGLRCEITLEILDVGCAPLLRRTTPSPQQYPLTSECLISAFLRLVAVEFLGAYTVYAESACRWAKVPYHQLHRPVHTPQLRIDCRAQVRRALLREAVCTVSEATEDTAAARNGDNTRPRVTKRERTWMHAHGAFQPLTPRMSFHDTICCFLSAAAPTKLYRPSSEITDRPDTVKLSRGPVC
jgi:hypothetical protein